MATITVQEALQRTVKDYNLWVSRNTDRPTWNDHLILRGIVYNKMQTNIRETGMLEAEYMYKLRNYLFSDDLECTFNKEGYLTNLCFKRPSEGYTTPRRFDMLIVLQNGAHNLVYESLPDDVCYQIVDFINQINNFKV